jgi:hypothetical protein
MCTIMSVPEDTKEEIAEVIKFSALTALMLIFGIVITLYFKLLEYIVAL